MSAQTRTLIIGRGRDCELLLTHSSISRRHAELTLSATGESAIRDLQSTGGTYILRNGKEIPVTHSLLKPTDSLRLGDYEISVKNLLSLIPEEAPPPKPAAKPPSIPGPALSGSQGTGGKTRMMRCVCGSIKERGKPCPDCGA